MSSDGKRAGRVPEELHSELSEYTSLLRALRTSNTLDLSSHLSQAHHGDSDDDSDSLLGREKLDNENLTQRATSPPQSSEVGTVDREPEAADRDQLASTFRGDTWTRWPLLAGDVNIPEWGLDDEISLIASQAIKLQTMQELSELPNTEETLDTEENFDNKFLRSLSYDSTVFLSRILAAISLQLPALNKSLSGRLRPMNWEMVLSAVAATQQVSPESLSNVKSRLEVLYGSSASSAAERSRIVKRAKDKLGVAMSLHKYDFLDFNGPPPPKRKRKSRKKVQPPEKSEAT